MTHIVYNTKYSIYPNVITPSTMSFLIEKQKYIDESYTKFEYMEVNTKVKM